MFRNDLQHARASITATGACKGATVRITQAVLLKTTCLFELSGTTMRFEQIRHKLHKIFSTAVKTQSASICDRPTSAHRSVTNPGQHSASSCHFA